MREKNILNNKTISSSPVSKDIIKVPIVIISEIKDPINSKDFDSNKLASIFFPLIEKSDHGILLIDNNCYIKYSNQKVLELLSINRGIINKNLKDIFNKSILRKIIRSCKSLDLSEDKKKKITFTVSKDNGELLVLKIYLRETTDQLGNKLFILTLIDITNKKKLKKELQIAQEKAESASKLKTVFLSQMSHEIRTPINKIVSFCSLLRSELEDKISDELADVFKIVDKAGRRIINTMELILNLSEIQANSYKCIYKKFDIKSQIIEPIIAEYKVLAKEKGLFFNVKFNAENLNILADRYSLTKVFTYLIDNAIKYTNKGGVSVLVDQSEENKFIVKISDTGIGISEEYLPDIFNPFSQEEKGYTRSYEGNGIGLSLVKEYCTLNNVDIKVESKKERGTTFTLSFRRNC